MLTKWLLDFLSRGVFQRGHRGPPDALHLLHWTLENVNTYFTALPQRVVWLGKGEALTCIKACQCMTASRRALHCARHAHAQEGLSALYAFAQKRGWRLFKVKPKLHMQQEIMHL